MGRITQPPPPKVIGSGASTQGLILVSEAVGRPSGSRATPSTVERTGVQTLDDGLRGIRGRVEGPRAYSHGKSRCTDPGFLDK